MNYSRSIKKNDIGKRVMRSWVIVALITLVIGGIIGVAIGERKTEAATEKAIVIYGEYDGLIFSSEAPIEWETESEFIPLDIPLDNDLQEFIYYLALGYDIDFSLVMALIEQESGYNVDAVTGNNYGLMQINQVNFDGLSETLGITDFKEPYNNVRAGLFMLRKLFEKYESPAKVLMAYNMGEYGAARLWGENVFETNYTRAVLKKQEAIENYLKGVNEND